MTSPEPALHLAAAQFAPVLRDVDANARFMARCTADAAADLLVTPELSLTGYDIGDGVHHLQRAVSPGLAVSGLDSLTASPGQLTVGLVEAGRTGPFNTAVVLEGGRVVFRHRKLYLPTYGMFDEGRWFGRGATLETWSPAPGWTAGMLVCEDFWHPGLAYVLASRGIDVLVVPAAAPGRGAVDGGEHGMFASADIWERNARVVAQLFGIYVVYANRVGVEGGITFAGGSLIAGPDGAVLARAGDDATVTIAATATKSSLEAARRPYSHARDDDPRLVLRELSRGMTDEPAHA